MRYTKGTLKKVETLLKEIGYTIRYEKGSFVSGYAIVEHRKIAVINRFFDAEARVNAFSEILSSIEVDESALTEESLNMYYLLQVAKKNAEDEA